MQSPSRLLLPGLWFMLLVEPGASNMPVLEKVAMKYLNLLPRRRYG
jgi:hypothetical protein